MGSTSFPPESAGAIRLAPDLSLPSSLGAPSPNKTVVFDPSGALTTALNLSGKYAIYTLTLTGMPTGEIVTVKLTVDDVVIWNDVGFTPSNNIIFLYGQARDVNEQFAALAPFICKSTLLLEVQTVADSIVTLNYLVRPIL